MGQLETNGATSAASTPAASAGADTDAFYEDKIRKLARLTQQRTVNWHVVDASSIPTLSFARVLTAYEASFGGENLRLIETGYEKRSLSAMLGGLSSLFSASTNEMGSIVLSLYLVDRNGRPTFQFPAVGAIYVLLSEIRAKQADVAGFLNALDAAVDTTAE